MFRVKDNTGSTISKIVQNALGTGVNGGKVGGTIPLNEWVNLAVEVKIGKGIVVTVNDYQSVELDFITTLQPEELPNAGTKVGLYVGNEIYYKDFKVEPL